MLWDCHVVCRWVDIADAELEVIGISGASDIACMH